MIIPVQKGYIPDNPLLVRGRKSVREVVFTHGPIFQGTVVGAVEASIGNVS